VGGRTYPDGGVELSIFRIRNGSIEPEALPSNLDWSDYFLGDDLTLGIRFNALPQAGYLLGFYVVTVVPFDGSPSRLLFRPELDVDGGLFVLPDGGLLPSSLYPQAFQVEADGTVLVAYWDLRTYSADACSIGQYTPSDEWRELVEISERCAFHTLLLANASTLYVTTESSLWRVDRETGSAVLLLTGLDLGGFNAIDTLAESDGSLVFNRLNGRGADLDQLGPDLRALPGDAPPSTPLRRLRDPRAGRLDRALRSARLRLHAAHPRRCRRLHDVPRGNRRRGQEHRALRSALSHHGA